MERQVIHDLWPLHDHNYVPGRAVTQSREAQVWPFPSRPSQQGHKTKSKNQACEFFVQVTVFARDNGNILEQQYAEAVYRLDMYIQNRIKVREKKRNAEKQVRYRNVTYTYKELCLQFKDLGCPGNKHVHVISDLFNHGINITYPTFRIGTRYETTSVRKTARILFQ